MDIYEQLYEAFTNPTVQPARRTFGKIEYAFIPVAVIQGVLEDALYTDEDTPDDDMGTEVAGPTPVEDDVLATVEPAAEESFDPPTGAGDTEPLVIGTDVFPDDEADGEVAIEPGEPALTTEGADDESEEE